MSNTTIGWLIGHVARVWTQRDDCLSTQQIEQVAEQLDHIGQRVQIVHSQLTDLRLSENLLVAALLATTVALLGCLAHLWWRTRRAESDIQLLRRVRTVVRR